MDGNTYLVNEFRIQGEHLLMITDTNAYQLNLANMTKGKNYMHYKYRSVTKPHDFIMLHVTRLSMFKGAVTSKLGHSVNGYAVIFVYMTGDHPINVFATNLEQEITAVGCGILTFDGGTYHLTSERLRQWIEKYPGQTMDYNKNMAKYGQQALVNSAVFR